jgi:hypothetical protein
MAKSLYYLPGQQAMSVQVAILEKRLWLRYGSHFPCSRVPHIIPVFYSSPGAVHLLAVSLIILSWTSALLHVRHHYLRRRLRLWNEPGTIASAVTIGGETHMSRLLNERGKRQDISEALEGHTFSFDPKTMKIFMDDEGKGFGLDTAQKGVLAKVFGFLGGVVLAVLGKSASAADRGRGANVA